MENSNNMKFNRINANKAKDSARNAVDHLQIELKKNKFYFILTAVSILTAVIGVKYTVEMSFFQALLPQLVFSTIAAAAFTSAFLLKPGFPAIVSPIASVAFSLLITRDVTTLLILLNYIPVGLVIGYCIQQGKSRMQTVVRAGFISIAVLVVVFGYELYLYKGVINYDAFYDTVMDISRGFIDNYKKLSKNADELFKEMSPVDVFSDAIKTFLGAFLLLTGFIQVHLISFATKFTLKRLELHDEIFAFDLKWELEPSKTAAVVFMAFALIYASFQNYGNIGLLAATALVMYPIAAGLALVGSRSFSNFLKSGRIFMYVIILLVIFGMTSIISISLILLVFIGLTRTLLRGTKLDVFNKTEQ
ncbi:MAG: DUF2232 domain-containing protein [Eubacteriales bacterium]|nr:DUF2232 domain-containing protein [Eubacteriales bacterium]MDD4474527.1 DUF2232 domain-containing protein [Eubacteriales bacterium]